MTQQTETGVYENLQTKIATIAIDDAAIIMGSRFAPDFASTEYVVYSLFGGPFNVAVYTTEEDAYADFKTRAGEFLIRRDLLD